MSGISQSTKGGVDFDSLCNGEAKNYSFALVDLTGKSFENAKATLLVNITNVISHLEIGTGKKVERFCIGKTFAPKRRNAHEFDCMNSNTWRKSDGIGQRWSDKYRPEGYHGLVVLAAVTHEMLSLEAKRARWTQQHYALALEGSLIKHFIFEDFDSRLQNTSLSTGLLSSTTYAGYVVYMAYRFQPCDPSENHFFCIFCE